MEDANQEDLYDEFGNYIGPDLASSDDDSSSDEESEASESSEVERDHRSDDHSVISEMEIDGNELALSSDVTGTGTADPATQIVLHEDKVHYPSASTIYGPKVTTAVLDEDAMDISQPILPPEPEDLPAAHVADRDKDHDDSNQRVSDEYLTTLCDTPRTKRGVAIVGNLHTGKSTLVDLLLQHTLYQKPSHKNNIDDQFNQGVKEENIGRYTDTTPLERQKQMSLRSTPITLPLSTSKKTHAVTLFDNPGHIQFHDESVSTLKLADGCLLVIDIIEGLTLHDELLIRQTVTEGLNIVLVLNKMDRLIVDLKLPVDDAYYKIRCVLEEVNAFIKTVGNGRYPKFCPTMNVAFASAAHGWVFSLGSMADIYLDHVDDAEDSDDEMDGAMGRFGQGVLGRNLTSDEFTKRLWGNCYLDPQSRTFKKRNSDCVPGNVPRTFCQFVLEPIYKIYSACLGEAEKDVSKTLRSVGVHLTRDQLRSSSSVLLRAALEKFFSDASGLVDLIIKNV